MARPAKRFLRSIDTPSGEPPSGDGRGELVPLHGGSSRPMPFDQRVRVLCRTSLDALFVVDDDRRYLHLNRPAEELIATTVEEARKRRIDDYIPREQWPRLERFWAKLEREGVHHGRTEYVRGDGCRTRVEYRACRDFGPGEHLIAVHELTPGQVDVTGAQDRVRGRNRPLSPRESEVLQLAAEGLSTSQLADRLFLSPATVKTHFEHIYEKLGVRDRTAAVAEGLRRGLIR